MTLFGTLSKIYGKVVDRRNKRYDEGRTSIVTVDKPVISVGNLLVGGTGKTPVVQMIARKLESMGHRPAIIMRGYRRSTRGLLVVHDGSKICASAREAGDEAYLHAQVLNIPVVVAEHKVDAAAHAAGFLPCDVIIIDDGFQHRALHRDVDVVLVNRRTVDDPRLLPSGRLREPLSSLDRADIVLLTGDNVRREDVEQFCSKGALISRVQITAQGQDLEGRNVMAFAGIADPDRFFNTAKGCGANVVETLSFPDHHAYTRADVENVIRRAAGKASAVVTTEKDRVKLDHALELFAEAGIELLVVPIQARLVDGAKEVEQRIERIMDEDRHQ